MICLIWSYYAVNICLYVHMIANINDTHCIYTVIDLHSCHWKFIYVLFGHDNLSVCESWLIFVDEWMHG